MDSQAISNTYILLQRFRFPVDNTTRDAISVTTASGLYLVSLYTLIVSAAFTRVWASLVLLGVAVFMRKDHSYNRAAATVGLYNASESQSSVIKLLATTYLRPMKKERWYPLFWIFLAVVTIAGTQAASILIPKLLVIGHAAPVNSSAVYFPGNLVNGSAVSNLSLAQAFALQVPYFVRSAGQVELTPRNRVVVEQLRSTNPDFVQINYSYNVTAADFGLQDAPGLILYVSGSCYTEYGWLASSTGSSGNYSDTYHRWNETSDDKSKTVSITDGGPPFANFLGRTELDSIDISNTSYSIVVSSVDRPSFSASTDPWYKTTANSNGSEFPFAIRPGRPALSCWETDRFTYNGMSSFNGTPISQFDLTHFNLSDFASPDNNTPPFLTDIIQYLMPYSIMVTLGTGLGRSSLKSSTSSALGHAFNAGTSSIYQDLEFLVLASYIATKNMFVETTRFPIAGRDKTIPDVSRTPTTSATFDNSAPPRLGTGGFVITDPGITTLSIKVLIAIPVAMVAAFGAVYLLQHLPILWKASHALNATILYSHLHEHEEQLHSEDAAWNRKGELAFTEKHGSALIQPHYGARIDKEGKGDESEFHWLSKRGTSTVLAAQSP